MRSGWVPPRAAAAQSWSRWYRVGGGVIVNGKVIDGAHGAGGEIGHITVNRHETATCGCGKHGCLEQYSSATGVVRCMKKLLDENPDADLRPARQGF